MLEQKKANSSHVPFIKKLCYMNVTEHVPQCNILWKGKNTAL
jgi:hypothetical protein